MQLFHQLRRFGGVGIAAMAVHWCSVIILVSFGQAPLIANIFAFLIAFQVSYWGHRYWTFKATHIPHRIAMLRFFKVAFFGFLLNEFLFWCLLKFTNLPYQLALLFVLGIVAVSTFLLSKFWAFRS